MGAGPSRVAQPGAGPNGPAGGAGAAGAPWGRPLQAGELSVGREPRKDSEEGTAGRRGVLP